MEIILPENVGPSVKKSNTNCRHVPIKLQYLYLWAKLEVVIRANKGLKRTLIIEEWEKITPRIYFKTTIIGSQYLLGISRLSMLFLTSNTQKRVTYDIFSLLEPAETSLMPQHKGL